MVRLSASLIVRNEAAMLGECLKSLAGQVDEVVVVDTGSDDDTVEIATAHGALVRYFPWTNDFSAARNFCLAECSGDWILYIDADERLEPLAPGALKQRLEPGWIAADVRLRPRPGHTPYLLTRLFRRHPEIRFEGSIHETVMPSIQELVRRERHEIGNARVLIEHLGYEGDQSRKHARDLPLLRECCRTWPERVYYWHHLAEVLAALGSTEEARSVAWRGIEAARRNPSEKARADATMLFHLLARTELAEGRDPNAILEEALTLTPGDPALRLLLGQRHLAAGVPDAALQIAEALLAIDPAALSPGLLSYNEAIFGSHAMALKIASLMRMGRREEAALAAATLMDAERPVRQSA